MDSTGNTDTKTQLWTGKYAKIIIQVKNWIFQHIFAVFSVKDSFLMELNRIYTILNYNIYCVFMYFLKVNRISGK